MRLSTSAERVSAGPRRYRARPQREGVELHRSLKRKLAAGAAVLAAAAFAGGAYAATLDSPAHVRQAVFNDVARRLRVSPRQVASSAALRAAIRAELRVRLNRAVSRSELTTAQAQQILAALAAP